jgi:protein involved in polysaccharide export with SLBB domain
MKIKFVFFFVFVILVYNLKAITNIDDSYIVKTGDTFLLQISSPDTLTMKSIVMPNGKINLFPIVKPIDVAGRCLAEAESYVDSIIAKQIDKSFFEFNLIDISPISFTLSGAVHFNGQFVSKEPLTLLQAIDFGKGLVNSASKKIKIIRNRKTKIFDLNKYFTENDQSQNPLINQDDFIVIDFAKDFIKVYTSNDTVSSVQYAEITKETNINDVIKNMSSKPYTIETDKFAVKRNGLILNVGKDFRLIKNDELYLNNEISSINITGQVASPKSVIFNGNNNINYYIGLAGGILKDGSRVNIKIIHRNGHSEKYKGQKLQPGDTIYVPQSYAYLLKDFIAPIGTIITIIYTVIKIQTL